jgi:hypothetical protein
MKIYVHSQPQIIKNILYFFYLNWIHVVLAYLMGGHGNFVFNLVVKLSVELGCVFLNFRL